MIIAPQPKVDHRWFIWTVLFLIVSGVSLVSYIMITSINDENAQADYSLFLIHHPNNTDQSTTKKK